MAKRKSRKESSLYSCKYCGFAYASKKWQQKCEAWCASHNSCNIMITKHAVKK